MKLQQKAPLVSERVLQWLQWLQAAIALSMAAAFAVAVMRRLHLPFEYDWIEDGMLASIRHMRAGGSLYDAPTVQYVPYLYTPGYLYVCAAVSHVTGVGYACLRLVSAMAALGCFAAVYLLVWTETRRHFAAIAGAGLFAACYPVLNGCLDLARVDTLYLFFVLVALLVTRRGPPAVAALLWVLAFQTKQGVLPIAVLALCHDWQRPRRVLEGLGVFIAALAGSILWLTHATHGWYHYYVFGMAGGFGYQKTQILRFVPKDMLEVCGIALLVIAAALLAHPPVWRGRALSFYTLGTVGMVVFTAYLRAHRGANVNALAPAYAWIAVCFGVALAKLYVLLQEQESSLARAAMCVLLLAACVQMEQHFYSPNEFVATPEERAGREAFEGQLRAIPGDVMVYSHPEYGVAAGKPLYAGSESAGAVIEARQHGPGDALMREYAELIDSGRLGAVALDMSPEKYATYPRVWMPADFTARYPLRVTAAGAKDDRFSSQPKWIFMPCGSVELARRLDPLVDTSACGGS